MGQKMMRPAQIMSMAVAMSWGCAASTGTAVRPEFPAPRAGVFQDPVPIIKSTNDDLAPSIVPASGMVVYAAVVERNLDIYKRPLQGGAAVRLTTQSADDTDPELSPTGRQITWTSQVDDVKGDIWIMDVDGSGKRCLTNRDTADRAPTWSADGKTIYFTARARGGAPERIDCFDLESGVRRTVVERGWDPAVATDGQYLFYVALDERPRPRLYGLRVKDGAVAAVTDGAYTEGIPRVARGAQGTRILFARWVDDQTGDGVIDVDDAPSLWALDFDRTTFASGKPPLAEPLTAGDGGEIFASMANDWFVYTTSGFGDLEIYALPTDGMIHTNAGPEGILEAARAETNPALRKLALRYLVATTPTASASARYELARELAERERYSDAVAELQRVAEEASGSLLAGVSLVEIQRLQMLERLRGELMIREEAERTFTKERLREIAAVEKRFANQPAVVTRATLTKAEATYALGDRQSAAAVFSVIARGDDVPNEDKARARDRLGEVFALMGDLDAVAHISRSTLQELPGERHYVQRAAQRWIETARQHAGINGAAGFEQIIRDNATLLAVTAPAAVALAREQERLEHHGVALESWRRIADEVADPAIRAEALINLGESAEKQGNAPAAILAYEQIIAELAQSPKLRSRALHGLTRIALSKARGEEEAGDIATARDSYARLLRNNRELVYAHRRYIELSAGLGDLEKVLSEYEAAAETDPRDKFARYGYGYALTFSSPPSLNRAEREIEAALELDSRLGAAHLTLGWIREQWNERDARGGWLDRASDSYAIAWSLLDPTNDVELWAASRLNYANVLFKIGKTDDALVSYRAREEAGVPFRNPITELIFLQRYAQAAMREQAFELAQKNAERAFALADSLVGKPRLGTMAALNAALGLLTKNYDRAAEWYERARAIYVEREDWQRVIPMLRGKALSLQQLGKDEQALVVWGELLQNLEQQRGPGDARYCWEKPALRLLAWIPVRIGMLEQELPTNAKSVTGAICGFSANQEEDIARAAMARLLVRRGEIQAALRLDGRRVEIVRAAGAEPKRGGRVQLELLLALHESALLHARVGDATGAQKIWLEALTIGMALSGCVQPDPNAPGVMCTAAGSTELQAWADVVIILESLAQLWLETPDVRTELSSAEALLTAHLGSGATAAARPELSQRLSRWLSLQEVFEATVVPKINAPDTAGRFAALLGELDKRVEHLDAALALSRLGVSDVTGETNVLPGVLGLVGETSEAQLAPSEMPNNWRFRFDRSLWLGSERAAGPNVEWLDAAIDSFEAVPQPAHAIERNAFVAAAAGRLIARGDAVRAWRLLERDRLLSLQPSVERAVKVDSWTILRRLRDEPEKYAAALKKASALALALEGQPTTVAEVQNSLEGKHVLVQIFAPLPEQTHFFAIDVNGVSHVVGGTFDGSIPEALLAHLSGGEAITLYVDAGELWDEPLGTLRYGQGSLGKSFEVSEVLAATYLVASYQTRKIGKGGIVSLGSELPIDDVATYAANAEALGKQGARSSILYLGAHGALSSAPRGRPGLAQVVLVAADAVGKSGLDLDKISATTISAPVVIVDGIAVSARLRRAVAQAFLLAGVPTLIVGAETPARALVAAVQKGLEESRIATAVSQSLRQEGASASILGFGGMTPAERVDFALGELIRLVTEAANQFKEGSNTGKRENWQAAQSYFAEVDDTIVFLLRDQSQALLATSKHKHAKLGSSLSTRRIQYQKTLAVVHRNLDEPEEAARLYQAVHDIYVEQGDLSSAAKTALDLAVALEQANRPRESLDAAKRCVEHAVEGKDLLLQATCTSKRATTHRGLYEYDEAIRWYNEAAQLYGKVDPKEQIAPWRHLGFLYRDVLSNYGEALKSFEKALAVAEAVKAQDLAPGLMLDIVTVFRKRGAYDQALERAFLIEALGESVKERTRIDVTLEIARLYWYRGSYRRALDWQEKALKMARAAKDAFRETQAVSLAALVALNQGELVRAEELARNALELARATGRRSEEAAQLNNLGKILREAGRITEAIAIFRDALVLDVELGSVEGRAYDLRNLAVALHRQGNDREALERVNEALALSRSIGEQYNQLESLFAAGEILDALGIPESSERYAEAAQIARKASVPEIEWRSVYALGRKAEQAGDTEQASRLFEQALQVAERLGRGQSNESTTHSRDDLYAAAIDLAIAAGDTGRAYSYIERSRARDMLDVLAGRTIELPSDDAKAKLTAELRAKEAVVAASRHVLLEVEGAAKQLREAEDAHRVVMEALRERYPRLARIFTITPASLEELQRVLPAGTVVLSFFVGRNKTTVIAIDGSSADVVSIALSRVELSDRVGRIRLAIRAFGAVEDQLAKLADVLMKPLRPRLQKATTVVVLPQGPLHHLPFAALPDKDGEPMLQHFVIARAPSGSILFDQLQQAVPGRPEHISVFAPSADLPFSGLEAASIAGTRANVGAAASEATLREVRADAIDIAAHGELDPTDPLSSAIVLWPPETEDGRTIEARNDGRLELHEVFSLPHAPRLITLSACDSAISAQHGNEWLGLGGAFLTAGSRTVIASANRVSDLAAAVLMKRFYRSIRHNSPGEALREAALSARRYFSHPAHWAGFVLIGDYR